MSLACLVHVGAVDVVGPDGGEGGDVAGHAAHESGDEGGDAQAEQARAAVSDEHEREHFVVGVLAGCLAASAPETRWKSGWPSLHEAEADEAGKNDDERHRHLEGGADDGSHLGGAQIVRGKDALDDEEVGGPVAEAE